jgi:glucosamine--fructose-6-phosphate aminotransferase (isomerizing)
MNNMTTQIKSLPDLVRSTIDDFDHRVAEVLTDEIATDIERIFITGCGDSFYAGLATKLALKKWTGCTVEVASSLSAGRYEFPYIPNVSPKGDLFIGISVSGGVSRTIEAIQIANEIGGRTLAITGNEESPLALTSDLVLNSKIEDFAPSPGVRTYQASMLMLYLIGLRIASVKKSLNDSEIAAIKQELLDSADVLRSTIEDNEPKVQALAEALKDERIFHFVSHGPNLGTAYFSSAKLIEAAGVVSNPQDTEEWAHIEHYEDVKPAIPTFIISPGYRTHGLAKEFVFHMNRLGRFVVAVTPDNDDLIAPMANVHLPVMGNIREELSPFVYLLAAEIFAAVFADVINRKFFCEDVDRYMGVGDHRKTTISTLKDL